MENNNIEKTTDHKVVSSTSRHERDSNSRTDYTGSCKSNYHTVNHDDPWKKQAKSILLTFLFVINIF